MTSYSKNLMTNITGLSSSRSLTDPIDGGSGDADFRFLTNSYISILRIILTKYAENAANMTYESIPADYEQFVELATTMKIMLTKTTNPTIILFLQIAEATLYGAVNTYSLYGDNVLLQVDKHRLEKQVDDILANKNTTPVENTFSYSNMHLHSTFRLAAVFNYYIKIYGVPCPPAGFDPIKISFLTNILTLKGIDPYG
jgi:hypothetical protein